MSQIPTDVAAALEELDERNRGYLARPLPDALDERIARLVKAWAAASAEEREAVVRALTIVQAQFLAAYAERMATFAVRMGSPALLHDALVALLLAATRDDPREELMVLTLVARSAQHLGLEAGRLFAKAAETFGSPVPDGYDDMARRPIGERELRAMGYEERPDDEGLRYVRSF